jgi:cation:H+ antiporter
MRMNGRQIEEVFLTAAQSLFAVAVISSLSITRWEAVGLLILFFGQFAVPVPAVRIGFGIAYIVLTVGILALSRAARVSLIDSVVHVFRPSRRARGARG